MEMMTKTTPKQLCARVDQWLADNYFVPQKLFDKEILHGISYVDLRKKSTNCWPLGPVTNAYLNIHKFLNSDYLKNHVVKTARGERIFIQMFDVKCVYLRLL